MGRTKYMMTIEDLASHPIEIQISKLSFGELGDDNGLIRSAFMIERIADQWSPSLQQTNSTGQQMQVSIRKDVLGDWGHLLKRTIYSFSNVLIQSIQYSGTGEEKTEAIHFDSEGFNFKSDSDIGAVYRGPHKGRSK